MSPIAWSTPLTAVSNSSLTAAQWNASVRDDLLETAPAKATAAGRFMATTAANAIAERVPTVASVATAQTTSSASFVDLTTAGPSVTVASGPLVLLCMHSRVENNTLNGIGRFAADVSGATTAGADVNLGFAYQSTVAGALINGSCALLYGGLNAGNNTFKLQYRTDGSGTGTWSSRRNSVVPF